MGVFQLFILIFAAKVHSYRQTMLRNIKSTFRLVCQVDAVSTHGKFLMSTINMFILEYRSLAHKVYRYNDISLREQGYDKKN